ncbi:MAG TPA: NADP-dependent oxidoreductase [Acetobacteraceae bacterium]|nr:NADP-dependent oxidoreductase [Acetobacteraceae bacterium]
MTQMRCALLLRRRPTGEPGPEHFEMVETPLPEPAEGQVLLRTIFLSIDPYMRGRLYDRPSYAAPVQIGEVMTGETVAEVVASAAPGFAPGDVVVGGRGWETHGLATAKHLVKLDPEAAPLSTWLGVLGMPGVTAYYGMKEVGRVKPGETVVVSAASGPVGSVAGQLAKRAGARVVGVAGGAEKCLWVQETLGFDDCVDHRTMDLRGALQAACPNGIDVYFENVGGATQAAVIPLLNVFSRMIVCGMVAQYNDPHPPPGPNLAFLIMKRALIQGILVSDRLDLFPEWRALAAPWVKDGSLRYRETVVDGLENAPEALAQVLRGGNFGKMLVRVGRDPG